MTPTAAAASAQWISHPHRAIRPPRQWRESAVSERIGSLGEIGGPYRAVLCDLWGCYHDGIAPFAEAITALRRYRAEGGIVVLLTNAPRPVEGVVRFLGRIGAPSDSHDGIMSSGEACVEAVRSGRHGRAFHYVGPERDADILAATGCAPVPLGEADALLCTGLRDDRRERPEHYRGEIAEWAARGLPMLCANPDIVVDRGTERLWCAGALARDYAAAGGEVSYFGKPYRPVYEAALALVSQIAGERVAREDVLAIGDGPETDLRGAATMGMDALFVTAGIVWADYGSDPENPDAARLSDYLARTGLAPAYWMPRLA